jgi:hypothetical protein
MEAPSVVQRIGERVGMTPIAWKEHEDRVVIVFEQGPKMTFMLADEPKSVEPEPAPKKPVKRRKAK